jgi:hypothetical protein
MIRILQILIGIGLCVLGGKIGIRRLLYGTIAAIAAYAAVAANKAYFDTLSMHLRLHMSSANAAVFSIIILSLIPLLSIGYWGRKLIVRLQINERISATVDSILGAGFLATIYAIIINL